MDPVLPNRLVSPLHHYLDRRLIPTAPASAIVILGMAGYFTGVVQTPITAFMIALGMADNHTLPLVATSLLGYLTSHLLQLAPTENFRPPAFEPPKEVSPT